MRTKSFLVRALLSWPCPMQSPSAATRARPTLTAARHQQRRRRWHHQHRRHEQQRRSDDRRQPQRQRRGRHHLRPGGRRSTTSIRTGSPPKPEGDCDDCDPNVNPNALEVATPGRRRAQGRELRQRCRRGHARRDLRPRPRASTRWIRSPRPRAVDLCKTLAPARPRLGRGLGQVGLWPTGRSAADRTQPPSARYFHLGRLLVAVRRDGEAARRGERLLALSSGSSAPAHRSRVTMPVNGLGKGLHRRMRRRASPRSRPLAPASALRRAARSPPASRCHPHAFEREGLFLRLRLLPRFEWPHYVCNKYNDFSNT